ncbi:MAG: hypothetical protein WD971_07070 [Pirellulales bacterium]
MRAESHARNSLRELTGLVLALIAGAAIDLMFPFKAEAAIATSVISSLLGAVIWTRRRESVGGTVATCALTILIGWPIAFVLLDWLHRYF